MILDLYSIQNQSVQGKICPGKKSENLNHRSLLCLYLTSLDMRGTNVPPIFKIALKNYFISIPGDEGLRTENPRSLGIQAIFAIFRILIFVKICYEFGHAFESRARAVFYFPTRKYCPI